MDSDSDYWRGKRRAEDAALQNHATTHSCLQQELEDAEAAEFHFESQGGHTVPLFDGLDRRESYQKYRDWVESRRKR